jgi:membrane protein YqaA with SNARE-associated domain
MEGMAIYGGLALNAFLVATGLPVSSEMAFARLAAVYPSAATATPYSRQPPSSQVQR